MAKKYLDLTGLGTFWTKVKTWVNNNKQDKLVSGTNIKTINGSPVLGSGDLTVGGTSTNSKTYYGTCASTSSTADKIVTCSGFTLETGARISVKFDYKNTAKSATLNINGTGAISISCLGSTGASTRSRWGYDEIVDFIYDGTYYEMVDSGTATTSDYGVTMLFDSTSSTSTTMAATPNSVKAAYDLANAKATVTMTTTDPGEGATLAANNFIAVYAE